MRDFNNFCLPQVVLPQITNKSVIVQLSFPFCLLLLVWTQTRKRVANADFQFLRNDNFWAKMSEETKYLFIL